MKVTERSIEFIMLLFLGTSHTSRDLESMPVLVSQENLTAETKRYESIKAC